VANLNQEQLRRLARLGAVARLSQLREEEAAIRSEFPDLFRGGGRKRGAAEAPAPATGKIRRRRRRKMSAEARKAASERMQKFWAERRKAKAEK